MPIKGLTERNRFVRAGKFRLGEKKRSERGTEYPSKIDHFLCSPNPGNEHLAPLVAELFGERPKSLRVCFVSDDADQVFPQWYKCYSASGLLCKGDGETGTRVDASHPGDLVSVDCPGPAECEFSMQRGVKGRPGCKQVASLQFMLPDLPGLFVWQIDTSSYNSILNLNSGLRMMHSIARRLSFVEVKLAVQPQQVTNPGDGKKVIIYAMHLELPVSLKQIHQLRPLIADGAALPPPPAPSDDLPDDLYPASQIAAPAAALPAPAAAPAEEAVEAIDPETGEVLGDDGASWEAASEEPLPLDRDPDVLAAMTGFSDAKRTALLRSAEANGWNKAKLIERCGAAVTPAKAEPAPAAPMPNRGLF